MPISKEDELRDKLADVQILAGINDQEWEVKFGNKQGLYGLIHAREETARKETTLHFRKIAQRQKSLGYGCGRIIGETNVMAKNKWLPLQSQPTMKDKEEQYE